MADNDRALPAIHKDFDELEREIYKAIAEHRSLRADRDGWYNQAMLCMEERDRLRALNAELVKALEDYKRGDLLSNCRIILERAGHPQLAKGLHDLENTTRAAIAKTKGH